MKMQVNLERVNDAVLFKAENDSGNKISIDGSDKIGGIDGGFRPMQLLLAGIGGCSAMDAVSILKKQKQDLKGVKNRDYRSQGKGQNAFRVYPYPSALHPLRGS